jgi:hypothetical protein
LLVAFGGLDRRWIPAERDLARQKLDELPVSM